MNKKLLNEIQNYGGYLVKRVTSTLFEIVALVRNKSFYCDALNGYSWYNLAINSDMTLSCNCNDQYGLGKIGDLNKESLKEIFNGKKAKSFRTYLKKGKLPIINCIMCNDLKWINKKDVKRDVQKFKMTESLMIENTVNCNLNCLSCNRQKIYSLRSKNSLSLEDIKKVSQEIKINKIKCLYFYNLGEPFFSKNINQEIEIIRKDNSGIYMSVSTNGVLIDKNKLNTALLFDYIVFSIHGSTQNSLKKYQKGGHFNKSYENMKNLVKIRDSRGRHGPKIVWKYVLFRWNDSKKLIQGAIRLAEKAGIDEIYFERTLSPLYGISYRHYLGIGYLNKINGFKNKKCSFKLKKRSLK